MSFIVVDNGKAARRKAQEPGFEWGAAPADAQPARLLRWDTGVGARMFAAMNGGKVTTEAKFFSSVVDLPKSLP